MAKRALKIIGIIILALAVVVAGYIIYLQATYSRIDDMQSTQVENNTGTELEPNTAYTAVTYNIGFGAYTSDYTFFMDEGRMLDGTETVGESSRAASKESVEVCTASDISTLSSLDPDFVLLQEVDSDSDRSYHVNQKQLIQDAFPTMASTYASNFHSAYLAYPITNQHGTVNSGLLTLSSKKITSAIRRSYPIDEAFPSKFFDLDRCFEVHRLPVSNGHELVLINSHMSAYDKGGTSRVRQLAMLNDVLKSEYDKGNYVICGGDWNQALCGSLGIYPTQQERPDWVAVLDDKDLTSGFSVVKASNIEDVASCRDADIPYEKGVTYTSTVDGFIVSDNVRAEAENIDTGFATSDHNPVKLSFKLKD